MKSNGLTKWLLSTLTIIGVAWVFWVSAGIVQAKNDQVTLNIIASDVKEIKDTLRKRR